MAPVASRLQSGLYTMQIAILDSSDRPMGQLTTPDAPVNGTVYSPYVVPSPVQYTAAADTIETAYSFAAQRQRGKRDMGISTLGEGQLELSEFDDTFDALVQGYVLDTVTGTQLRISGHNANRNIARRFMLAFTPAATPANSAPNYDTIFTWGTLRRGALSVTQNSGRNPNNRTYTVTKFLSTRNPWGQLFSASVVAPNGSSDDETVVGSDAPMMFATWIANGTASSFTMPYAFEYTEKAGSSNLIYKAGASAHASVGTIVTATVALTGSGVSGDVWVIVAPSVSLLTT